MVQQDEHVLGVAAAQGHAHVVQPHGDRVAADGAFVDHLDAGALDEAELQQAALQFLDNIRLANGETLDAPLAPASA